MNFTALVDVAIGLTLIYVGVALLVTTVNELILNVFNSRARGLKKSLAELFAVLELGNIPGLEALKVELEAAKSYIYPKGLAQVIVGLAKSPNPLPPGQANQVVPNLMDLVDKLPPSPLKRVLGAMVQSSGGKIDELVAELEQWIDSSLKVLSDDFKRCLQWITLMVGFALAAALNLDSAAAASSLYADKQLRDGLVASAQNYVKQTTPDLIEQCSKLSLDERRASDECKPVLALGTAIATRAEEFASLPFGWTDATKYDSCSWIIRIGGWLLTAIAAALGAPFWFDLLNRLVNLRNSVAPPKVEKKPT